MYIETPRMYAGQFLKAEYLQAVVQAFMTMRGSGNELQDDLSENRYTPVGSFQRIGDKRIMVSEAGASLASAGTQRTFQNGIFAMAVGVKLAGATQQVYSVGAANTNLAQAAITARYNTALSTGSAFKDGGGTGTDIVQAIDTQLKAPDDGDFVAVVAALDRANTTAHQFVYNLTKDAVAADAAQGYNGPDIGAITPSNFFRLIGWETLYGAFCCDFAVLPQAWKADAVEMAKLLAAK